MNSLKIQNAIIYDGTGAPGYEGALLIRDGRIVQVGRVTETADRMIDAHGQVVCPGFVDIHRHCDAKPLTDPEFGRRELAQGITTTVVGNCGISMTPRPRSDAAAREYYDFQEAVLGPVGLDGPVTYRDYRAVLEAAALPLNMAAMVGTGTVKIAVKGFGSSPMSREELDAARDHIADALEAGAPGVSLGIMYIPECWTSLEEYVYMLEPVGRYGRVITTHIRGEGDSMVESVREVLEIARRVGCALEISHFKSCGMKNWRRDVHTAIRYIEEARNAGQDVTVDFYPYEGGSTALTTMLPPAFVQGDMTRALERLGTARGVEEFRRMSRVAYDDWDNFCITLGWDRIIISGVSEEHRRYRGLTVTEAARRFGFQDAEELAAHLMHSEAGKTAIINMSMCQDDIDTIAGLPYSHIISDAIYAETDTPHPRMYGAFPKVIREYVKERKIYTLNEAIARMTDRPARRMRLQGVGRLAEGYSADVLIFDPNHFQDYATFTDPARMAEGLSYCIVGGEIAVDHDEYTGIRNGRLL